MARRRHVIGLMSAFALAASSALAQDKPLTRPADLVTGMLLFCMPVAADEWTKGLCAAIDKEAVAQAKSSDMRFVPLTIRDTDATNKQKARDAGFDPANAAWVLVKVQRLDRVEKGWSIGVSADGIAIPQPGEGFVQRRVIYTQGAILDAKINRGDAEKAGKTLVQGLFQYYAKPSVQLAK